MFLFGVFLWGPVQERAAVLRQSSEMSENQALIDAGMEVTDEQIARVSLPRRFSVPMREMLQLQPRFLRRQGRRTGVLLEHRRFRAAYDLLVLRCELGEVTPDLVDWWTKIQTLSPEEQQKEFGGQQQQQQRQGSRGRRRRRPAASAS
jgi:poly(A) polymerase